MSTRAQIDVVLAARGVASVQTALGRVAGIVSRLRGLSFVAAGILGGGIISRAISEAKDSVRVYGQLAQAVSKLGSEGKGVRAMLVDQAAALQSLTGVSDETVATVQTMLLSFGASGEQARRATPLVLDLAAAMGVDAVTAARRLGATLREGGAELKRYGVTAKTLEGAIAELELSPIRGRAAAAFATEGGFGRLRIEFADALENLGRLALPALSAALNEAASILGKLNRSNWGAAKSSITQAVSGVASGAGEGLAIGAGVASVALAKNVPALVSTVRSMMTALVASGSFAYLFQLAWATVSFYLGKSLYHAFGGDSDIAPDMTESRRVDEVQRKMMLDRYGTTDPSEIAALRSKRSTPDKWVESDQAEQLRKSNQQRAEKLAFDAMSIGEKVARLNSLMAESETAMRAAQSAQDYQSAAERYLTAAEQLRSIDTAAKGKGPVVDVRIPESELARSGLYRTRGEFNLASVALSVQRQSADFLREIRDSLATLNRTAAEVF